LLDENADPLYLNHFYNMKTEITVPKIENNLLDESPITFYKDIRFWIVLCSLIGLIYLIIDSYPMY